MGQHKFGSKFFWVKKMWSEIFWGQKNLGLKFFGQKKFVSEFFFGSNKFGSDFFGVKKIFGLEIPGWSNSFPGGGGWVRILIM